MASTVVAIVANRRVLAREMSPAVATNGTAAIGGMSSIVRTSGSEEGFLVALPYGERGACTIGECTTCATGEMWEPASS